MRQSIVRFVLFIIVILVVFGIYRLLTVRPLAASPFVATQRALLIADAGQASQAPPYTLAAFQAAQQAGADGLFLPLQLTRDGHLVVLADENVALVTGDQNLVSDLTLADIQALDASQGFDPADDGSFRIPTLEEALTAFPALRALLSLPTADERAVQALLRAIDVTGAGKRILVLVDDQESAQALRRQAPDFDTAYTPGERSAFVTTYRLRLTPFYRPAAPGLVLAGEQVSRGLVQAAHSRGVYVVAVSADDLATVRQLLDLNVDAVITQRLDAIAQLRR